MTISEFVTISTGITSNLLYPLAFIKLIRPSPVIKEIPPAAERESVHPGKGSLRDEAIIAGLSKTTLKSPFYLKSVFSAKFLVNVYVFGNLPISVFS